MGSPGGLRYAGGEIGQQVEGSKSKPSSIGPKVESDESSSSISRIKVGKRKRKEDHNDSNFKGDEIKASQNNMNLASKPKCAGRDADTLSSYHPLYPFPTGHYQKHLQARLKLDQDNIYFPLLPLMKTPHIIGGLRDLIQPKKQCNCKKSHCLKLYCECFASGVFCNPNECHCTQCKNREGGSENDHFSEERANAVYVTLERNPSAFRPRFLNVAGGGVGGWSHTHDKGGNNFINMNSNSTLSQQRSKDMTPQQKGTHGENVKSDFYKQHDSRIKEKYPLFNGNSQQYQESKHSGKSYSNIATNNASGTNHFRGCNCRKSFCLKKYCECFQAAVYCSQHHCRCTDCQNIFGNEQREKLISARRDKEALSAAAVAAVAAKEGGIRNSIVGISGGNGSGPVGSNGIVMMGMIGSGEAIGDVNGIMIMGGDVGMAGLPPSSFAVPMQMDKQIEMGGINGEAQSMHKIDDLNVPTDHGNGLMLPPIAFGVTERNTLEEEKRLESQYYSKNENSYPYTSQKKNMQTKRSLFSKETDLQRKWRKITDSDLSRLESIRVNILQDERAKIIETEKVQDNTESKIKQTLRKIEKAMQIAKDKVIWQWEQDHRSRRQSILLDPNNDAIPTEKEFQKPNFDMKNETQLNCEEKLLPRVQEHTLSEYAAKEFAILEAQDAAMLHELAISIKEEALFLAQERRKGQISKIEQGFRRPQRRNSIPVLSFPSLNSDGNISDNRIKVPPSVQEKDEKRKK